MQCFGRLLFLSALAGASARIISDPSQVVGKNYDFIIVGGGTAGGVVAARLSEALTANILVIEAGLSDTGDGSDIIEIPFLAGQAGGTQYDWNYTTVAQSGLNGRTIPYPRGFVLGGSSSINNLVYFRGPSEDFDRFAAVSGDPGWSWSSMQQFITEDEKHVRPWNNRDDTGEFNPAFHGQGPLLTSVTADPQDIDFRVINTTKVSGGQFPFNEDLNSGNGLGVGWVQSTVGNNARSSSSTAFLTPAANSHPNLDVLIQTQVTRLLQTGPKDFRGVEFSKGANQPKFNLTAGKEVILSAGSIGTPQLLMLSGIGPHAELNALEIPCVVDIPDVGKNLQDQPIWFLQYQVNQSTLSGLTNNQTAIGELLAQYLSTKMGLFASVIVDNVISFARLPASSPTLKKFGDPSAGPHSPHFVNSFLSLFIPNPSDTSPTDGNWISIAVVLQSPTSRGSVTLATNSAFDHPNINPGFLTTSFDISASVEAVKQTQKFISFSPWKGYIQSGFGEVAQLKTDAEIEAFVRNAATTIKHPVSTASVSKVTDKTGVVGPDLKVKGVTGLRVVDGSVLPSSVGGFPQARIYLIAERASVLIRQAHA